jgi:hypothetical protein
MKSSQAINSAKSKISGSWNCEPVHIGISGRERHSFRNQVTLSSHEQPINGFSHPHYN